MNNPTDIPPSRIDFGHIAEEYEASRGVSAQFMQELMEDLINTCKLNSQTLVLDLGCGSGRFLRKLANRNIPVIGIDISKGMLEKAFLNQRSWKYLRSNLITGDAITLPFHRGLFSCIILIHLLHLLSDWKEVLSEAIRVLQPDGTLITGIIPAPAHLSTLMQFYIRRREELGHVYKHPGPHPKEVFEKLTAQGARVDAHNYQTNVKIPFSVTLSFLEGRVFSSMWQNLPDVVHRQIMQEIHAFTTTQFKDINDIENIQIDAQLYFVTFE